MKTIIFSILAVFFLCACGDIKKDSASLQTCSLKMRTSLKAIAGEIDDLMEFTKRTPAQWIYSDDFDQHKAAILEFANEIEAEISDFERENKGSVCMADKKVVNADKLILESRTKLNKITKKFSA